MRNIKAIAKDTWAYIVELIARIVIAILSQKKDKGEE